MGTCPHWQYLRYMERVCFEASLSSVSDSYGLLRVGCGVNNSYSGGTVNVSVVVWESEADQGSKLTSQTAGIESPEGRREGL